MDYVFVKDSEGYVFKKLESEISSDEIPKGMEGKRKEPPQNQETNPGNLPENRTLHWI